MNYRKIAFIALLAVLSVASLTADTVWEGTAAMSRYGEFPVKGLYGASNSFTANTVVTVENSVNKKSAEIIIVDNLSDKNLFLLLSKDASEKLGIRQDEVITVKVKMLKKMETPGMEEAASGKDPDNNPPVSGSALLSERIKLAEKAEAEDVKEEMAEDALLSGTGIAAETENPETAGLGIVKEAEAESGDSVPSEAEPAGNDAAETTGGEEALPVTEYIIAESLSEDEGTGETVPADGMETAEEGKGEEIKKYVLIPTGPKPPEEAAGTVAETAENVPEYSPAETADNNADAVIMAEKDAAGKEKQSSFIQLAAFRDYNSAEKKLNAMKIEYPAVINYDKDKNIYRIMAGPFSDDEKGAALYNVRNSGFKDAFIKKSE